MSQIVHKAPSLQISREHLQRLCKKILILPRQRVCFALFLKSQQSLLKQAYRRGLLRVPALFIVKKAILKSKTRFVAYLAGACLTWLALGAHALSLGELRGTALIGQPLDISVALQTGPGDDVNANCLSAEVFHADARQAPTVLSLIPGDAGALRVRVHSSALVDEPVVSIELRASCGNMATRRYTLLADIVPTSASLSSVAAPLSQAWVATPPNAPSPVMPAGTSGITDARTRASATPVVPAVAARAKAAERKSTPVAVVNKKAKKPTAAPGPSASVQAAARGKSKSVLKLDPTDVLSDRIDGLDSSQLFEASVDALNQARQVAETMQDIKTLRERVAKSDAELRSLKSQLQAAQDAQIPLWWLVVLAALLLLCLGALAWLLLQQRRARAAGQPKWHDSHLAPEGAGGPAVAQRREPTVAPVVTRLETPAKSALSSAAAGGAKPKTESAASPSAEPSAKPVASKSERGPEPTATLPSGVEGLHSFSVEPILDLRQQAEFFVSLGQTDRAVSILKKQIDTAAEPNPFIYLDLLALYHSLGLKSDFRDCRTVFNRCFNGVMPDFPAFHLEGNDLLAYPDVLDKLVADWPSAKTLVLLNAFIFRNERTPASWAFDLAAFRDLLLLHALAEELATDLNWDTASTPLADRGVEQPPYDTGVGTLDVESGSLALPERAPAKGPGSTLPEELRMHALDMDFSAFNTGPAVIASKPPDEPPPTEPARL